MFIKSLAQPLIGTVINVRDKKLVEQFGIHLKKLRLDANYTQEELANEADIPINQVGRIERGEVNPTLSTLNAISKALRISLPELLKFNQ